ncbi:CPBP family intramembrane glutamic endopeptidase [Rhodanobacter sp. KK11]|jgi:membrane protease YdiL (CAAX protease family)|uniref:CPBP family intramembrane glutamic endopeptidase n=1 Tax=Rhodanobacter sp. KK11 TaxID=3083255 RepID=UPI0029675BA4|nr:CPBP family intramembrane glutamic endopeptidase [Rhodanobacter sp. KK11]MDW2980842.1 CPBP family intramembrane glutamic endopeptidase [Rhodanobacter sp. KK11]
MEIRSSEIPPRQPPGALPAPKAGHLAPGLRAAAGIIATYFALQFAVSTLFALAIAAMAFPDAGPGIEEAIRAMLAQPAMQALLAIFSLGVAAPLTLWLARRSWPVLWSLAQPPGFGFTPPRRPLFFALALAVGLAAPFLGAVLTQWLAQDHTVTQGIRQIGDNTPPGLRVPLVLVVVGVGPLAEELLFRGVLLSALMKRMHTGWAVAGSSLLFALVHLPGLAYQWYALPNLLLLALLLAGLRLRSGSIWPAVLAHGVNNLLATAAWFMAVNPPG